MNNYPIVLAHGIARLDYLTNSILPWFKLLPKGWTRAFDRLHYFKGISNHLARHGFDVHKTDVSFAADVSQRASELREQIEHILHITGKDKVHIIGHSMGGLDARHMIVDEGMEDYVSSLTSIGTPHLGTYFADWGLNHGGDILIKALRKTLDLDGFLTLTRDACTSFNDAARDREASNDVVYQTYSSVQERSQVFGPLHGSWQLIFDEEGENDGLVSASSQAWTHEIVSVSGITKTINQRRFPFAADHLNQIAWWDFDELSRTSWWKVSVLLKKRRFEQAVKNVYLGIARDISALS